MKKQIILIFIMCILAIATTIGIVLLNSSIIESNAYVSYDMPENKEIVSKIYEIDEILLQNSKELSEETKIEVVLSYILNNIDVYKNQIIVLKQEFTYEQDEEIYTTNCYVDVSFISKIAKEYFDINNVDITKSKYYDYNTGFVALVSTSVDSLKIEEKNCLLMEKVNDKECKVKVEYYIDKENNIKINVIYYLIKENNGYIIKEYSVLK